jgi:hypothetical protein
MHIGYAKRAQQGLGFFVQPFQAFHAVHLHTQAAEHRSLVAAAGADFQHAAHGQSLVVTQQSQHAGHHAGLGDGLTKPDGQAGFLIRLVAEGAVHKAVTLHLVHGLQHGIVVNTL